MNFGCTSIRLVPVTALVSQVQMQLYHRLFDFVHWKMELLEFTPRSQNCGISVFEMLGRFGLGGQVWPYMHNSNQKSSNCNKEVAPKTCHFKQTICRLQKILIFTQLFPFSSLNLWFTHVLSRKCRKWHLRALVGSFSLKSRMVGRLDNSGAGLVP